MKLHRVEARTGILWVRSGIRTFFRQPLALAGLFFMFMLVVSLLTMIPILGHALALALLPAATLGLMAATREADQGQFPMPSIMASAFRAGKERMRDMLTLGALYAIGSGVVMGLTALIMGDATPATTAAAGAAAGTGASPPLPTLPAPTGPAVAPPPELLLPPHVMQSMLVSMLLYLPLGFLFWHAPALVHWHGVSPVKSLFFSALACWTNKGALLVYFFSWAVVFFTVSLAVVLLAALLGGPRVLGVIVFPVAMLMSAIFFTSLYFTFRDSFVTDDGQSPA